ncbi:hypothetical protein BDW59DRAFT_174778 [Aspergillus cavernicola]|uniref:Protein kinase domain-containing protein n=1 Tax=Aspergillus cavernicola TaxID=176166 RepID=A0ABR4HVY9_9EURO
MPRPSDDSQYFPISHDPYIDLPVIGIGMTGVILLIGEGRVVKKAKQYFKRLGNYQGIISCFQTSQYGIQLALAEGDLASYLETYPEREDLKIKWILSLIETFLYVHSCRVFVDDIALRNILIIDKQLELADFGQSILLPPNTEISSANENDLTVQIEVLHLAWILYSIASWHIHKYYFFSPDNPNFCWPSSFPNVDAVLYGKIFKKCWNREYASMDHVKDDAYQLLAGH